MCRLSVVFLQTETTNAVRFRQSRAFHLPLLRAHIRHQSNQTRKFPTRRTKPLWVFPSSADENRAGRARRSKPSALEIKAKTRLLFRAKLWQSLRRHLLLRCGRLNAESFRYRRSKKKSRRLFPIRRVFRWQTADFHCGKQRFFRADRLLKTAELPWSCFFRQSNSACVRWHSCLLIFLKRLQPKRRRQVQSNETDKVPCRPMKQYRRLPVRDAAAQKVRAVSASRLRGVRKHRKLRTLRETYRKQNPL